MEVILDGVALICISICVFLLIWQQIKFKKRKEEKLQQYIKDQKLKIEKETALCNQNLDNTRQKLHKADLAFQKLTEQTEQAKKSFDKLIEAYKESKTEKIEKEISEWTVSAQNAADAYMNLILEENRKEKASAALQLEELKKEIEDFRIRRESLNEAIRKEREMENLQDSHRIQLSDFDKEDIHFLVSLEDKMHNKELLHKLIWTEYLQKPFNQMINRICGANIPKNVVYCIENIETHEKYIGKTSASYKDRMSNHIKASLGLGQLTRQQIHKALFGNWDKFMFSIIEEVGEDQKLSDREKFYIETFQSNQYGYNMKV